MKSFKELSENITKELWKDIPGFEGLYQASNFGQIRSLDRIIKYRKDGSGVIYKGKILTQHQNGHGYNIVVLYDYNHKHHNEKVHRLVAKTFIDNPKNYPVINHINQIKTDNRVDNLEWCSYRYNAEWSYMKKNIFYQYDLQGNLINIWKSLSRAAEAINGSRMSLTQCILGKQRKYKGFIWSRTTIDKDEFKTWLIKKSSKPVVQFDLQENVIKEFGSAVEASRCMNCTTGLITMACRGNIKTAKGFIWKYKENLSENCL